MNRTAALAYGSVVYVIFVGTFLYMMGFVANLFVPKSIDSGTTGSVATAILINTLLLGLFAVQHAVMARPRFKAWWTRFVPPPIERSTFVLVTCLVLALLVVLWRPIETTVWRVEASWARTVLLGLSLFGWVLVLYSSFLIDHFDLFGLRQVWLHFRGRPYTHHPFVERSVYKLVRHPLMLGFLIAFWSTPDMTGGHLLFALLATGYIVVGTRLEERDLVAFLGDDYLRYRARTAMFLPRPKRFAANPTAGVAP